MGTSERTSGVFALIEREDFHCPCCNKLKLDDELFDIVKNLEKKIPGLKVTSGYRCEKHNKKVGGAENSYHMKGMAADLTADSYDRLVEVIVADMRLRNSGVIIYERKRFCHIDTREIPFFSVVNESK